MASQNIDSLFTVYNNNKGYAHEQVGQAIMTVLSEKLVKIDTSYFQPSLSHYEKDVILIRSMISYYFSNDHYRRSIRAAENLLNLASSRADTNNIIVAYYYLGFSNQRTGDLDKALKYNIICYELASAVGDQESLSSVLNNMGNIYMTNKQLEEAINYFQRSIEIEKRLERRSNISTRLGNLSTAYLKLERYEDALSSAQEALKIDQEMNRPNKIAIRFNQLGNIYMSIHNYDSAFFCQQKALSYFEGIGSDYGKTIAFHAMGEIFEGKGLRNKAVEYYERAMKLAKKSGNNYLIQNISYSLYSIFRDNQPGKALDYYELYVHRKDSIFDVENQKMINDFVISYETREKEIKIAEQERTLANDRLVFLMFGIASLLVTVIVFLLFRLAWLRKRRNKDLSEENAKKDLLLSLFSHDLKNTALSQQMVLHHLKNNLSILTFDELNQILEVVSDSSDAQVELLLNMLNWARIQTGKMEFMPNLFPIADVINNNIKVFENQYKSKNLSFECTIPANAIGYSDRMMISAITRNFISNAIKFSYAGQTIEIKLVEKDKKWMVCVIDHGVGISEIDQNILLNGNGFTRKGTNGETGSSVGLSICKKMADICKEQLLINSEFGKGSAFCITITKG